MKKLIANYWLLVAILFLAAFLRFYKLNTYPALNADEAAIGYNAYSLIKTGLDEHGHPWPINFQSFNDYKPGGYFYLALLFVKAFGLNIWSVRLPGAILGVLSVYLIYLLFKELFNGLRLTVDGSLLAAFFLAISPWHIHFSRGGWEVNAATFFITFGVYLFLKALKNPKLYVISFLFFIAGMYTYHAARVVVPLLGLGLLVIYRKEILKKLKPFSLACLFGIILLIPLVKDLAGPAGVSRAAGVGLFADPGPLSRVNEQRGEHSDFQTLIPKLLHNKAVNYSLAFANNWAKHYWGEFLFLTGDSIQRDKVPEMGEMYLADILFLAIGFVLILRTYSLRPKSYRLVLYWLIVAPVASALTFQSPHALRAHNMVIPLSIISALGFSYLVAWLKNKGLAIGAWGLVIVIVWCFARYLHLYWVHMAKQYPFSFQYGLPELVSYVEGSSANYKNIVVTTRYDQPYILFLFYMKYDPVKFQKEHILAPRDQFGFSTVPGFGKYRFISFGDWDGIRNAYPNSVIIGTPDEVPQEANIVKRVYGSNGYEYFDLVAN